jgi:hypothetical protein
VGSSILSQWFCQAKAKLKKYFSGKLVLVQIGAGLGAVAGRSLAVYLTIDQPTYSIVICSMLASFGGYVCAYIAGYWFAFKADYSESGRSMPWDIVRLQLVEQSPNLITLAVSGATQGVLIESADMSPILAVNLGSWFGPQKIVNLVAMFTANSLKRAWVDGTWKPLAATRSIANRVVHPAYLSKLLGQRRTAATPDEFQTSVLNRLSTSNLAATQSPTASTQPSSGDGLSPALQQPLLASLPSTHDPNRPAETKG